MDSLKFSIIIPLYNKEKYIQRAVDSVLNQTYQNFELIIVDDGSTDGSLSAIKNYTGNPKIRIISQNNKGACSARNTGINSAMYKYIIFLDADDAWMENFLKEICNLINQYPDCGIYATSFQRILSSKKIQKYKFAGMSFANTQQTGIINNLFYSMVYGHDPITTSSSCIPKHIFNSCGTFREDIGQLQEDVDMWIRISLKYPIAFSGKICMNYHCDADNRACLDLCLKNDTHPLEKTIRSYIQQDHCSEKNIKLLNEYLAIIYFSNTVRCLAHLKKKLARKLSKKITTNRCILKIKAFIAYLASFLPNFMLKFFLQLVLPAHSKKMGAKTCTSIKSETNN